MQRFKILEDLSSYNRWTRSYRYTTLKIERDGKTYLYKQANDDLTKKLLKNEVRFRQFFSVIDIQDVSCTAIVEEGNDYLIFEWVENPLFLSEQSHKAMAKFEPNIDRYVDILVAMDQAAENYSPETDDSEAIGDGSKYNAVLMKSNRLQELVDNNWIDTDRINKATEIHAEYRASKVPRYQHGDFIPWHIFSNGKSWLIYDAEHANSQRPRFQDLIHSYFRIANSCKSPKTSSKILKMFIEKTGVDQMEFINQSFAVFIERAIGNLIDSYSDRKIMSYRENALTMLDRVLEGEKNFLSRMAE